MPRHTAFNTSRRQALNLAEQSASRHGSQLLWVLVDLAKGITFCEDHPGDPGSGGMTLAWSTEYDAKRYARAWRLGDGWRPQPYTAQILDTTARQMRAQGMQVSWRMAGDEAPLLVADHIDPATGAIVRVAWGEAWAWYAEDELGAWLLNLDNEI